MWIGAEAVMYVKGGGSGVFCLNDHHVCGNFGTQRTNNRVTQHGGPKFLTLVSYVDCEATDAGCGNDRIAGQLLRMRRFRPIDFAIAARLSTACLSL